MSKSQMGCYLWMLADNMLASVACVSDRDIARKLERANRKKWKKREGEGERGNFPFPTPSNILFFFDGKVSRGVKQYTASVDMR